MKKADKYIETPTILDQLKGMIRAELDMCDAEATPYVCDMKTADYNKVENYIIEKIKVEKHSVNSAITALELEFNPNHINS